MKTHFSNFPFSSSSIVDKKISKNLELLIDLNIDLYITLKSSWVWIFAWNFVISFLSCYNYLGQSGYPTDWIIISWKGVIV